MVGKPQGRKARSRTEASAGPVGYGDLNGGSGPGKLDSGTDVGATALRGVKPVRSEPCIGTARVQERWMSRAMTMGVCVSQAR
jgi:hypothetical protein